MLATYSMILTVYYLLLVSPRRSIAHRRKGRVQHDALVRSAYYFLLTDYYLLLTT